MATTRPVSGYKFKVSVPGKLPGVAGFSRVSGLESETEVVEYREGTDSLTNRKFRGLVTFPAVVLEKGVTSDSKALSNWYKDVSDATQLFKGKSHPGHRSDANIQLLDREDQVATTYKLKNAWPMKLQYDDLDAGSSDILVHRLELAHEGLIVT